MVIVSYDPLSNLRKGCTLQHCVKLRRSDATRPNKLLVLKSRIRLMDKIIISLMIGAVNRIGNLQNEYLVHASDVI